MEETELKLFPVVDNFRYDPEHFAGYGYLQLSKQTVVVRLIPGREMNQEEILNTFGNIAYIVERQVEIAKDIFKISDFRIVAFSVESAK